MENIQIQTVKQLLSHLLDARNSQSEMLMKEVWENCNTREDFKLVDDELDRVIIFLTNRKLELEK